MQRKGKRGQNEGSIYKRADGRWVAVVNAGYEAGKRKRKSLYGKTRREVQEKLVKAQRDRQQGLPATDDRRTVGDYFNHWLQDHKRPAVKAKTYQRYEELVRIHVKPTLGRIALSKLSPADLQHLYAGKLSGGLSARTIGHLHRLISGALKQAVLWGFLARNVADAVAPPRVTRREMQALTAEQARAFLNAAEGSPWEALFVLAVTTGMRQGEMLGLKWSDVDIDGGWLQVRRTLSQVTGTGFVEAEPKTAKSRRRVPLTSIAIAALLDHQARQAEQRLALGPAWDNQGFVFPSASGGPMDYKNLTKRVFAPLLSKAEVPTIRFHDLRHTAASLMLAQGVHPKVAQEVLGHSQVSVTLDTYSHVVPPMLTDAAHRVEAALA